MRWNRRPTWRWTTGRSFALGAVLTLLVVAIDGGGGLKGIERSLYDWRALNFQHFTPPPSDWLVHLDIDDAAIETVGRWPWARTIWVGIVDELRLAGADVLGLDIIFSEPTTAVVNGRPVSTDDDANLLAAFDRFGRVLIPISFGELRFPQRPSPQFTAARELLRKNPALDERELVAQLPAAVGKLDGDTYLASLRAALCDRIDAELARDGTPTDDDDVRRRVLSTPGQTAASPLLLRQFDIQLRRARAVREMSRFSRERPPTMSSLLGGADFQMLPSFARAARYSGSVDVFDEEGDATIRGVPLWIEHGGRIYPQFDLALACAALGADVSAATTEPDRITVPLPDGRSMVVPVRDKPAVDKFGTAGVVGGYFDIPWFGWIDYEKMYDYPAHRESKQHVPMAVVWGLAESRKIVVANNRSASAAIANLGKVPVASVQAFLAAPEVQDDIPAWLGRAEPVARDLANLCSQLTADTNVPLSSEEQNVLDVSRAVQEAVRECRRFLQKADELKRAFAGKVVLVGSTTTSALDQRPTSLHAQCPGVVIHGVVTHSIMTGASWRYAPGWVTVLITAVVGLAVTATVTWLPPWKALVGTVAIGGAYVLVNGLLLFDYGDRIVGLAGPLVAGAVVWGLLTVVRFVTERAERARITKKFRGYVDPQVVEYFLETGLDRFEGQVREVTVCFTDLAGFTTMTERLKERAVPILGRYVNRMVKVMRRHRGVMNRLMGDGIMFSYGAPKDNPNHAADAVDTVLEMQEEMVAMNRELAEDGLPQLAVRGGVSTGNAVVGDSGGADACDFTCLGDTTNFGARLESANKYTGTKNLISARTVELIGDKFLVRPVALLQVAGKTQSVMTYEPLARAENATDEQRRLAEMTRAMVDHYQAARFADCVAAADALEAAFGPFKLANLYRDTCHRYLADGPPATFKGEIVLTEK